MSNISSININVDKQLKDEALDVLNDLGLSMSSAISIFLNQVVRNDGIPFEIKSRKLSKKLIRALDEAEDIASGKKNAKSYDNVDDLFKDIGV